MLKDLTIASLRSEVTEKLGPAYRTGERKELRFLGMINEWDKYLMSDHTIHFEYAENGKIALITLGSLSLEKNFE